MVHLCVNCYDEQYVKHGHQNIACLFEDGLLRRIQRDRHIVKREKENRNNDKIQNKRRRRKWQSEKLEKSGMTS